MMGFLRDIPLYSTIDSGQMSRTSTTQGTFKRRAATRAEAAAKMVGAEV